jgi:hypothetical protein
VTELGGFSPKFRVFPVFGVWPQHVAGTVASVRGKWSKGIEPRNFAWVLKDQIAICERPGGHTASHRRVRRHEEIIWIREHGFHKVISLMPSPHNLHAYEELHVPYLHVPCGPHEDIHNVLVALYPVLRNHIARNERVLMHQDEISDRLQGVLGGYLIFNGTLTSGPQAVTVIEKVMSRQLGPIGREIINVAAEGLGA